MTTIKNLVGKRFGQLTVIAYNGLVSSSKHSWVCKCDCGKIKIVREGNLLSGGSRSCGCKTIEAARERWVKHGMSRNAINFHPLYQVWRDMKRRCTSPSSVQFHNYGGRGITVCCEWALDFQSFYSWAIKNGYRYGLQIDRIDNDMGYAPSNCRWVTNTDNQRNKRNNHRVSIMGETKTIAEWCEEYNLTRSCFANRLMRGWSGKDLILPPLR